METYYFWESAKEIWRCVANELDPWATRLILAPWCAQTAKPSLLSIQSSPTVQPSPSHLLPNIRLIPPNFVLMDSVYPPNVLI